MKTGSVGLAALLFLAAVGLVAGGTSYALYYDCSGVEDTALVVMNSGGEATYYTLKIYDAYGTRLDPRADSWELEPYESEYHVLSDLIAPGEATFGLVLIETPGLLTVGVETFENETWCGSDNIEGAFPEEEGYTYYWYGLNYSSTPEQTTGIVIANPNPSPAAGTLFLYDSFGDLKKEIEFSLDPHETNYYHAPSLLGVADALWGAVDVKAIIPILIAAEYFDSSDVLLNVDQVTHFYYAE